MARLEEPDQVSGRRVIGHWEIYTTSSKIVRRRESTNTKIVARLGDGAIISVFQFQTYANNTWAWMEVEYEPGKTGWINVSLAKDGQWVKKY